MPSQAMTRRAVRRRKPRQRSRAVDVLLFLFLLLLGAFMALPLVYVFSNAFKPMDELFLFPPKFFPSSPTFQNVRDLFTIMESSSVPMLRYIFNTVFITLTGTVGYILLASMCAFVLTKKSFPGQNLIFQVIWVSLMFSASVTTIPNFIIMTRLGMVDTYWALIIPAMGQPMGLYLMRQFMIQIPDSLIEAATIDGAGDFRCFWKIVMPLSRPAWLTLMIFSVQGLWNQGESILIYSESLKTFPYALTQIVAGGVARAGVGAAATMLIIIVPVGLFIISQGNIMQTMATSGMKD